MLNYIINFIYGFGGVSTTWDAYISGASASVLITAIFPFSDSFLCLQI